MSIAAPLVRCEQAGLSYGSGEGRVCAVREVSCVVNPGDRIAIVGPSGSGKSTLLHLFGGLEAPDEGSVSWPAIGEREDLRPGAVATIFQGPSLLPPLDVVENVALPLLLGGMGAEAATAAARAALAELDLEELAAKLPEELSGGQAQRVAVARVLATAPRLILADEPTGQLDHATGDHMLDVLDMAISRLRASLVITTHDRRVAERQAVRWTMADGRLAAEQSC